MKEVIFEELAKIIWERTVQAEKIEKNVKALMKHNYISEIF